jgi:hypothetical protein
VLGAFPIFLVLGYLLSRSKAVLVLWLFFSAGTGVALTALFTTWRWVAGNWLGFRSQALGISTTCSLMPLFSRPAKVSGALRPGAEGSARFR